MEKNLDGLIPGQPVDFATIQRIERARRAKEQEEKPQEQQEAPRRGRPPKERKAD